MSKKLCIIIKREDWQNYKLIGLCKLSDIDADFWLSNNTMIFNTDKIVHINEHQLAIVSRADFKITNMPLVDTNGRILSKLFNILNVELKV